MFSSEVEQWNPEVARFYRRQDYLHIERQIHYATAIRDFDHFSIGTVFVRYRSQEPLRVWRGDRWDRLPREGTLFIPPQSTIRWGIPPGRGTYHTIVFRDPKFRGALDEPVLFERPDTPFPWSCPERLFDDLRRTNWYRPIGVTGPRFELAVRAKQWIHRNLRESLSIRELSQRLRATPEHLSRSFRIRYGLPPIQYANKLRVLDITGELILNHGSVTTLAFANGFEDLRHFQRQFRRVMRASASEIREAVLDLPTGFTERDLPKHTFFFEAELLNQITP